MSSVSVSVEWLKTEDQIFKAKARTKEEAQGKDQGPRNRLSKVKAKDQGPDIQGQGQDQGLPVCH